MDLDLLDSALNQGIRLSDGGQEENEEDFTDEEFFEDRHSKKEKSENQIQVFDNKPIKEEIIDSASSAKELLKKIKVFTKENIALFDDGETFKKELIELLKDKELDVNDADLMKLINVWNKTSVAQLLQVLVFDRTIRKIFSNNQKINFFVDDTLQDWQNKYDAFTEKLQELRVEKLNESKSEVEKMYLKMEDICKEIKEQLKNYKQNEIFSAEERLNIADLMEGKIIRSIESRHFNKKSIQYINTVEEKTKTKIKQIAGAFAVLLLVSIAGMTISKPHTPQQQVGAYK